MYNLSFRLLKKAERLESKLYIPVLKFLTGYNLIKLSKEKTRKFITWYLNQEYDFKTNHPLAVFNFLEAASKKIDIVELDELAAESKFMNSMPEEIAYRALKRSPLGAVPLVIKKMELLTTFLTSKISSNEVLICLINSVGMGGAVDFDYAFRKLASEKDIDTLLAYDKKIDKKIHRDELARKIAVSNLLTLEEIKKYFLEAEISIENIIMCFSKMYEQAQNIEKKDHILTTFISIIDASQKRIDNGEEIDVKTGEYIPGYNSYMYSMSVTSISEDMKNEMVKKLLDCKNYHFINEWL